MPATSRRPSAFIAQYTTWNDALHGVITRKIAESDPFEHTLYEYAAIGD